MQFEIVPNRLQVQPLRPHGPWAARQQELLDLDFGTAVLSLPHKCPRRVSVWRSVTIAESLVPIATLQVISKLDSVGSVCGCSVDADVITAMPHARRQ